MPMQLDWYIPQPQPQPQQQLQTLPQRKHSSTDNFSLFARQSGSGSCILLARAIVNASSAGLIDSSTPLAKLCIMCYSACDTVSLNVLEHRDFFDVVPLAGTVFIDLVREVLSWERFAKPVSADVHSISPVCGSSGTSMKNHVHFSAEGPVKVSPSVFKVTRPAASAMMIHCMTQLLPCILKSTLASFKALRALLPLLDLSKLMIGIHRYISIHLFTHIYNPFLQHLLATLHRLCAMKACMPS